MQDFWDRVGGMTLKYEDRHDHGYLEIKADNITYRSIPPDEYGVVLWVSWEPFKVIYHFSTLTDPRGTIKWVAYGDADKPCGD